MSSSNEMYDRGVADAEQDDLNLFYYQHYYHYRRGYDKARRRVKVARSNLLSGNRLLIVLAGIMVVAAFVLASIYGQAGTATSETAPNTRSALDASPIRTPRPTATPRPTSTATPVPATPTTAEGLRPNGQAQVVNLGGATLLGRSGPGINEPVQTRFAEGSQVTILEGPVEADGYVWWRIENETGSGWSAERSAEGVVWLQPL